MQTKDSKDMLSSKMEKLRHQAEKVSRNLSGKLDELEAECSQALASGSKNAQSMVALTLNGTTEFIKTLDTQVDDFCQLSKEDESEIQPESEMKASLSELTERVKVLEKSALAVQTRGDDKKVKATGDQVQELKDSYDTLSTQLTQVSGAPVGFTAILRVQGTKVKPDSELGGILYAHINRGNCYKDQEGHFVAPRDGLYGFFFWVQQRGNVRFNLRLVIEGGSGIIYPVNNNSAHSALYVYDLSSNTRVYLKVKDSDGQKVTLDDLIFTGWSIGYH